MDLVISGVFFHLKDAVHPGNVTPSLHCTKEKLPTPIKAALELQDCGRDYGNSKP